jgi:putative membrane protein
MRRNIVGTLLAVAFGLYGAAALSADDTAKTAVTDEQFVEQIGHVNAAEVRFGRLARRRFGSESVKDYGRMLQEDHIKAQDKLRDIAKARGLTMPEDPNAEQNALYEKLDKLSGDEFDREFTGAMVKGHQEAIGIVEPFAENGKDEKLKGYAKEILPDLKHHLETAQELQKKVSGT